MKKKPPLSPETDPSQMTVGRVVLGSGTPESTSQGSFQQASMQSRIAALREFLAHLRRLRDSGEFNADGSHSFREWCMKQFGERMGGWLEEML